MTIQEMQGALLDSMVDEIVYVNTDHIIEYMNKAALKRYAKRPTAQVGKSIFECHNEKSRLTILEIFDALMKGEEERFIIVNRFDKRVIMRAVRDENGKLLGYYERFEKA
jgi:DUF438 domain-containing protein